VHNCGPGTTPRASSALPPYNLVPLGDDGEVVIMASAIERIVDAYVQLRNRIALEELRDHRQKLVDDLNSVQSNSEFNSSRALQTMVEDLVAINAGFERLEAAGEK